MLISEGGTREEFFKGVKVKDTSSLRGMDIEIQLNLR